MNTEIITKVCTKCKEEKALDEFGRRKSSKDGSKYQCKSCEKRRRQANKEKKSEYDKAYREANREKITVYKKAYREANREKITAKKKVYYEANREEILAKSKAHYEANKEKYNEYYKAYYETNKEKIAAKKKVYREANKEEIAVKQKKYREANKEKHNEYKRIYDKKRYAEDPVYRSKCALRKQTRRLGNYKSKTTIEIVGISAEEFWRSNGSPTEEQLQDLHIDHIVPLSWFDLSNEDHLAVSSHHSNLQYLNTEDNLAKGSRYAGSPDNIIAYKDDFDIEAYVTEMIALINIL